MLTHEPGLQYTITSDDEYDPDAVIVALAVRGKGTCELRIRRDRYDGLALLELIERHTRGGVASNGVTL
jgi:hypothetical protein